jgi:4-amino-4-deoxy-L-arabinose transferase-like glycosyltransferase
VSFPHRTTDSEVQDRRLRVLLVLVVVFSALQILTFDYGRDQGIYAMVARTVLDGGMPYRDAFDFKPPGIYLIYALARALFGPQEWGIRALEVVGLFAMVLAQKSLAARWWRDPTIGWIAAALTGLVHAQLDFWHTAQPETFGGMLSILGVWLACPQERFPTPASIRTTATWRYFAAGLAFGAAGLLKPPLAGGGAVLALWAAWVLRTRGRSWWACLVPVAAVLVGGVLPFAACLGWFQARSALPALYETLFLFTPHYTEIGWRDRALGGMLYQSFTEWLTYYCSLVTVGLFLGLATWRTAWRREGVSLCVGMIAVQLLGVALQGKFFPYHYAAVWPFTALVAALGWFEAWRLARARGGRAIGGLLLAIGLCATLRTAAKDVPESWWRRAARRVRLLAGGWRERETIDGLASVADVSAGGNRKVADELRRRVPAGGSAYIWGFEPIIYDLANVRAASRYIYNVPQRVAWASAPSRQELMCELYAARPEAIVVASGDVFPMVTGNAIGSSDVMERDFPELKSLLAKDYRKLSRIDDFDIYLRGAE